MTTPFPFVAGQVLTAAQLNDIQNLPISDKTASYTLIAGDETKRTIMNNASATTITVNNSIFTVGDVIQVANKGAGTCTITAGAGVTINTSGSLSLAQYGGGYLLALSASTFTFFNLGAGNLYGVATGGSSSNITVSGQSYTMLTFTTDANLVVSKAGLFDCLLVGGGGGGGGNNFTVNFTGGGGAGGVVEQTIYLAAATYAVDVGAGSNLGIQGLTSRLNTSFQSLSAVGGGMGAGAISGMAGVDQISGNGGSSGGGCGESGLTATAAVGSSGYSGGNGVATRGQAAGGGGGGGAVGGAGSGTVGGAGGAGFDASTFRGETPSTTFYAGGGGGGGASGGAGGSGGGGARTVAGTANTGGGGGGNNATASNNAAAGGSGIVLVRFKI